MTLLMLNFPEPLNFGNAAFFALGSFLSVGCRGAPCRVRVSRLRDRDFGGCNLEEGESGRKMRRLWSGSKALRPCLRKSFFYQSAQFVAMKQGDVCRRLRLFLSFRWPPPLPIHVSSLSLHLRPRTSTVSVLFLVFSVAHCI